MKNKSQEKNLLDFIKGTESQIVNVHTTSDKIFKKRTMTTLKINSKHNKNVNDLLQHIVQFEKSF